MRSMILLFIIVSEKQHSLDSQNQLVAMLYAAQWIFAFFLVKG